ncbi:actin-like ATPase domain-containing protein [Athelia psychrophila]|uniref:Actin-like ATPase domain-containing protein n=1 Tax=Athelia psychrophila TaxID=1759441 RepID=A0A166W8A8_9AGAM|nr:actin-like ATPase domain-containing protein [Fibularhizoctonia sp. CBS 109695]
MKPGVPFDVLLNKDSKRKIQSSVGWKKTDRLFGSDAYNIAGRFPQDSFSSLQYLLGNPHDSEPVSYFAKISTAETVPNEDGRTMLKRSDGVEWNVHELLAMRFGYIKSLAEDLAGEKVLDTILTVPPFFNQFEHDHIVDALELGGLRILALINDGTAVAVNYAMTRVFPAPEYHVIYDAGASSVCATVVQFFSEGAGKGKAADTQVAGVGYDREIGGTEMDRRLRDALTQPQALLQAGANAIVVSRPASSSGKDLPAEATVDYVDTPALAALFRAHATEVVVSAVGGPALGLQRGLGDAAKQGGVQLFVPSDFAVDTPAYRAALPVKTAVAAHLSSIGLPSLRVSNGLFIMFIPWLLNVDSGKIHLVGTGDGMFSATHIDDMAGFVGHVLTHLPGSCVRLRGVFLPISKCGLITINNNGLWSSSSSHHIPVHHAPSTPLHRP